MDRIKDAICSSALGPLKREEPDTVVRDFSFSKDFPGFSGHFPDYPVLPAVVQVLTAQSVAEEAAGFSLKLTSLERAKFLIQLRPDQKISVLCQQRKVRGETVWDARLETSEGLAAAFWMVFEQGKEGK